MPKSSAQRVRILSVGHEQKEEVKNWHVRVLCQFRLCTMAKKKQGYDHLSGMFDSTAKTPCLTQPALQFSGKKIKLLTKKNSEQMLNQQTGVVAHCKSLVACETPGHSTREGNTKMMSPKCEDYNSAGGGGVNSAGGSRPRTSATDRNSNNGRREKENARQRKRWRERQQQEKKRQTESARAQREHMD